LNAVDTVVCAPDDGCWYHPKHLEQFPDKINCVTLHLVGYIYITMFRPLMWPSSGGAKKNIIITITEVPEPVIR
jgi:hypothetical protein